MKNIIKGEPLSQILQMIASAYGSNRLRVKVHWWFRMFVLSSFDVKMRSYQVRSRSSMITR